MQFISEVNDNKGLAHLVAAFKASISEPLASFKRTS